MKGYRPEMSFESAEAAMMEDGMRGDEAETVAFLEHLARGGSALELAIGTGRIALPLAARGIQVDGIDFSPAMVARMRAKPGGDLLAVTMGDFADVAVPGAYQLVYVIFNSFFNLLTQEDQVRCFANVASRLSPQGVFVVEAYVPAYLYRQAGDRFVHAESMEVDSVCLDVNQHDPVEQRLEESHVHLSREGIRLFPVVQRYAWPCELDLMARLAGLRLRERWGGWQGESFTAGSARHISVYGFPSA